MELGNVRKERRKGEGSARKRLAKDGRAVL